MGKATLVIMAAGIGSRFGGGIKQLEPMGPNNEIIMDYQIYNKFFETSTFSHERGEKSISFGETW